MKVDDLQGNFPARLASQETETSHCEHSIPNGKTCIGGGLLLGLPCQKCTFLQIAHVCCLSIKSTLLGCITVRLARTSLCLVSKAIELVFLLLSSFGCFSKSGCPFFSMRNPNKKDQLRDDTWDFPISGNPKNHTSYIVVIQQTTIRIKRGHEPHPPIY